VLSSFPPSTGQAAPRRKRHRGMCSREPFRGPAVSAFVGGPLRQPYFSLCDAINEIFDMTHRPPTGHSVARSAPFRFYYMGKGLGF